MNRGPGEVDALLREREGYVRSGKKDRVRQVDAELAQFNIYVDAPEAAVEVPPENAVKPRGRPRKADLLTMNEIRKIEGLEPKEA